MNNIVQGDKEFAFYHFPKGMGGRYNIFLSSGFPIGNKARISSIYLIYAEFNDSDTISIATSHTDNEVKGNIMFIKTVLQPKQNYLTLPQNSTIILRLLINVNTGKFIFSLSDNSKEINDYIEKVKINLFYKVKDT